MAALDNVQGKLLAVIGDEDTCVGFLLGGIGEINSKGQPNFVIIEEKTPTERVEEAFKTLLARHDVAVLLITQVIAKRIRTLIDSVTALTPTVLEIPSQYDPYDPTTDSVMIRALQKMTGDDSKPERDIYH